MNPKDFEVLRAIRAEAGDGFIAAQMLSFEGMTPQEIRDSLKRIEAQGCLADVQHSAENYPSVFRLK